MWRTCGGFWWEAWLTCPCSVAVVPGVCRSVAGAPFEKLRLAIDGDGDEIQLFATEDETKVRIGLEARPSASRHSMCRDRGGRTACGSLFRACVLTSSGILALCEQGWCAYDVTVREGTVLGIQGEPR
jgi:hypothetical protein